MNKKIFVAGWDGFAKKKKKNGVLPKTRICDASTLL